MADVDSTQTIDRETASMINPLIGAFTEDTLGVVADVISDVGRVHAAANEGEGLDSSLYWIMAAASMALRYEIENPHTTRPHTAEPIATPEEV